MNRYQIAREVTKEYITKIEGRGAWNGWDKTVDGGYLQWLDQQQAEPKRQIGGTAYTAKGEREGLIRAVRLAKEQQAERSNLPEVANKRIGSDFNEFYIECLENHNKFLEKKLRDIECGDCAKDMLECRCDQQQAEEEDCPECGGNKVIWKGYEGKGYVTCERCKK